MITLMLFLALAPVKTVDLANAGEVPIVSEAEVLSLGEQKKAVCTASAKKTAIIQKSCSAYRKADAAISDQVKAGKMNAVTGRALMNDDWYEVYLRFVVKAPKEELDMYREHKSLRNDSLVNDE